jgi:hypothetical protein
MKEPNQGGKRGQVEFVIFFTSDAESAGEKPRVKVSAAAALRLKDLVFQSLILDRTPAFGLDFALRQYGQRQPDYRKRLCYRPLFGGLVFVGSAR